MPLQASTAPKMYDDNTSPFRVEQMQTQMQQASHVSNASGNSIQESFLSESAAAAVIDATRVLSDLPTQQELNGLLEQNKKLLEMWKTSQNQQAMLRVEKNETHAQLEDTVRRLRDSQWERGARERLERCLSMRALNRIIPQLEIEFEQVMTRRDVVHLFLLDTKCQALVSRWSTDGTEQQQRTLVSLDDTSSDVVKCYVSGSVLWDVGRGMQKPDVETMAAMVAWVPLTAARMSGVRGVDATNTDLDAMTSGTTVKGGCVGVAKIMYASVPSDVDVGRSSVRDLGRVGKLCELIGSFCQRHYTLYATENALVSRENQLNHDRLEMVNFLRHDWSKLESMFEMKRELQKVVAKCCNDEDKRQQSERGRRQHDADDVTISHAKLQMRISVAALVETHLIQLLGSKNDHVGLYLHDEKGLTAENHSVSTLTLVHSRARSADVAGAKSAREYLKADEVLAVVHYVGSTKVPWNSSSQSGVSGTATLASRSGSLLCMPILTSQCLGVICVWRAASNSAQRQNSSLVTEEFDALSPSSATIMDELDEHIVLNYCQHLGSVIENDMNEIEQVWRRREDSNRDVATVDVLTQQLSRRLSIFASRDVFFHQVSAGLKTLVSGTSAAYLFVLDRNDVNDTKMMWTLSCDGTGEEKVLTLTSRGLANSVMGEVMRSGSSALLNEQQCCEDPRCTTIDGAPVQNIMCVPLYAQHKQDAEDQGMWTVPSADSVGLFVFLNKKNSLVSSFSVVDFVESDLVVAKHAASVVAPLLQAWQHNSAATAREAALLNEMTEIADVASAKQQTQQQMLWGVVSASLQLLAAADSAFVFLSAATTACVAVLGSSCYLELFVEDQTDEEDDEDAASHSFGKWTLSEDTTKQQLKRSRVSAQDEKNVVGALRTKDRETFGPLTLCFKVEGISKHEHGSTGMSFDDDDGDDDDGEDDDEKIIRCLLKIVRDESADNAAGSEDTFLQGLERACSATNKRWIKCTAANRLQSMQGESSSRHQHQTKDSSEHMDAVVSTLHKVSQCETEEELCVAVADQLSRIIPGHVALLLSDSTNPNVLWSSVHDQNADNQRARIHVPVVWDDHPHGITGVALESGQDKFVSDFKKNSYFRADCDSHNQINSTFQESLGVLPLANQSGSFQSVLQVFPHKKKKKSSNKFSRVDQNLWKTVSKFVNGNVLRLKETKDREEKFARLEREHANLTKRFVKDQALRHHCIQAMQSVKAASMGQEPSAVIVNAQRELCGAFDFACVAIFIALDSETDVVKSAIKNDAQMESGSCVCKIPTTSTAVRRLFDGSERIITVDKAEDVRLLLSELPHLSSLKTFVPHSKVALCIPSRVVGGTSVFVAILDHDVLTGELISSVQVLGIPVVNAACSSIVAMDLTVKMEDTSEKLLVSENKCAIRDAVHNAVMSCKDAADLSEFVSIAKIRAKRLFQVEAADVFILDEESREFWTLDLSSDGSSDRRQVTAGEGAVLGSLSLPRTRSDVGVDRDKENLPSQTYDPVCVISNARNSLARNEISSIIEELASILMVPIVSTDGVLFGAIELANRKVGLFTHEDQVVVRKFADLICHDIQRHQSHALETESQHVTESMLSSQQLATANLETRLRQTALEHAAATSFMSSLTFLRLRELGISNSTSSASTSSASTSSASTSSASTSSASTSTSSSSNVSPVQASLQFCRLFGATVKNMLGAAGADFFIVDPSVEMSIQFSCKGVVDEHTRIPTIIPLVISSREAIFFRAVSDYDGDSVESCWPVVNADGNVIGCIHVHHRVSSSEEHNTIICKAIMPNLLAIASNMLQDMQALLGTLDALETLSGETDSLHLDFESKVAEYESTSLSLQIADCCLALRKTIADTPDSINKKDIDAGIELLCGRMNETLRLDQVIAVYGCNPDSERSHLIDVDATLLTHHNDMNDRVRVSSGSILSIDSVLLSSSTIGLGKSPCLLRSSASALVQTNIVSIEKLREALGKVVSSGAMLCSFGHGFEDVVSSEKSGVISFPLAKGALLFISSENRLDSFDRDQLARFCSEASSAIGFVVQSFMSQTAASLEFQNLSTAHGENTIMLRDRVQECAALSDELTKSNVKAKSLQEEVVLMEQHLQNEINARLQGQAAQSLSRVLLLWRQSSIQWYYKRWYENVKTVKRQRYIVFRITAKMHRGVLSHSFFIWSTLIAKELRHKRILRRAIDTMKFKSLHKCFLTWHDGLLDSMVRKVKMKRAMIRFRKHFLLSALNTWIDSHLDAKKGKRALKHWFQFNLSHHFNNWISHAREHKRIRILTERCVGRFTKTFLASSFATWCDLHNELKVQRTILERFTLRWQHLSANRAFAKLRVYYRQRQSARRKLTTMCKAITRTSTVRVRVLWQKWYIHVHFTKRKEGHIKKICAALLKSKDFVLLQFAVKRLKSNARLKVRVRSLITRVTKQHASRSVRAFFFRWCHNIVWLQMTEATSALGNVTAELQSAQQELEDVHAAKAHFEKNIHQNILTNLEKMESKLESSRVQHEAQLEEAATSRNLVEDARGRLQQQYESVCLSRTKLENTIARELTQLRSEAEAVSHEHKLQLMALQQVVSTGAELKRTNEEMEQSLQSVTRKQETLEVQLKESKEITRIEAARRRDRMMGGSNDHHHSMQVSKQNQKLLRQQIELLVNTAELEPKELVRKVSQLVYAIGADKEDAKVLTKQMFAHVMEILAHRREGLESLKGHLQTFMFEKVQINNQVKERRRSSISSSQLKMHSIVQNAIDTSHRDKTSVSSRLFRNMNEFVTASAESPDSEFEHTDIIESLEHMRKRTSEQHELSALRALRSFAQKEQQAFSKEQENRSHETLASVRDVVRSMHDQMRRKAEQMDAELHQSVQQELASLETDLIMADEDQVSVYKQSLSNSLERRKNFKRREPENSDSSNVEDMRVELRTMLEQNYSQNQNSYDSLLKTLKEAQEQSSHETAAMHKALEQEIHETLDSLEPHLLNRSIEKMKDALALQASPSNEETTSELRDVRDVSLTGNFTMGKIHTALTEGKGSDTATIHAAFQQADVDGSGAIDQEELNVVVESLGTKLDRDQLRAVFNSIDTDGSGEIDVNEFEAWWRGNSDTIDIRTKVNIETAISTYMDRHSGEQHISTSLCSQLAALTSMLRESKVDREQQLEAKRARIPELSKEIQQTASALHEDIDEVHKQLSGMIESHGLDNFNQALSDAVSLMELHEMQAKKDVQHTLEETIGNLKAQQSTTTKMSFRRLSVLDHHMRDTSQLVKHEIDKVNANVSDLHAMTAQEICDLSKKAQQQLEAISTIDHQLEVWGEEKESQSRHQQDQQEPYMSSVTSHVMEQAMSLSEARCEKAELKYERAVDHIRHLHSVIHQRRQNVTNRLSQLVALETVFLSAESVESDSVNISQNVKKVIAEKGVGGTTRNRRRRASRGYSSRGVGGSKSDGDGYRVRTGGGEVKMMSGTVVNLWR